MLGQNGFITNGLFHGSTQGSTVASHQYRIRKGSDICLPYRLVDRRCNQRRPACPSGMVRWYRGAGSSLQGFVRLSLRTRIGPTSSTWSRPKVHPCPGQTHLHFLPFVRLAELVEAITYAHRTDSGTSTAFQFGVSGHQNSVAWCWFPGTSLAAISEATRSAIRIASLRSSPIARPSSQYRVTIGSRCAGLSVVELPRVMAHSPPGQACKARCPP